MVQSAGGEGLDSREGGDAGWAGSDGNKTGECLGIQFGDTPLGWGELGSGEAVAAGGAAEGGFGGQARVFGALAAVEQGRATASRLLNGWQVIIFLPDACIL